MEYMDAFSCVLERCQTVSLLLFFDAVHICDVVKYIYF